MLLGFSYVSSTFSGEILVMGESHLRIPMMTARPASINGLGAGSPTSIPTNVISSPDVSTVRTEPLVFK
ncbi:hypothetical protein D3C75_1253260 [compost metagenome]